MFALILILIGENPKPDSLRSLSYLERLSDGAQLFLNFAKDFAKEQQKDTCLPTGLKMYESNSDRKMWDLCNTTLAMIDLPSKIRLGYRADRGKTPEDRVKESFFAVCILYMVSKASMISKQSSLGKDDISSVKLTDTNGTVRESYALEIKVLDVLFFFINQSLTRYNPFEDMAKIVGKKYDKHRDGQNLMYYIDFCLFKNDSKLTKITSIERLEDLEAKIPLRDEDYAKNPFFISYREDASYYVSRI